MRIRIGGAIGAALAGVFGISGPAMSACTYDGAVDGVNRFTCTGNSSNTTVVLPGGASYVDILPGISSFMDIVGYSGTDVTIDIAEGVEWTGSAISVGASSGILTIDGRIEGNGIPAIDLLGAWDVTIGATGYVGQNMFTNTYVLQSDSGDARVTVAGTLQRGSFAGVMDLGGGDDRLELHAGYTIDGYTTGGNGTDALALGGGGDGSFDASSIGSTAQFRDFEAFEKTGSSTWMLTGTSTASGTWTVNEGTLDIDPDADLSTMDVVVENGGRLTGRGTLGSLTVENGGVVNPTGHETGAMAVNNLVFNLGSTFVVTTGATTDWSRFSIGSATINGGWVQHVGTAHVGDHFIMTGSSITGEFDGVSTSFAFLDAELYQTHIDPMNLDVLYLRLSLNGTYFTAFASTPNQVAAAEGIATLTAGNAVYDAVLGLPDDPDAVRAAYDNLSGEIAASAKTALIGTAQLANDLVANRLESAFSGVAAPGMAVMSYAPQTPRHPAFAHVRTVPEERDLVPVGWMQAFGGWAKTDDDGNAASLERQTGGLAGGGDVALGDWRLGAYGAYSLTSFDADARASSGEADNYQIGVYSGTQQGPLRVGGALGYIRHDVETTRHVSVGPLTETLKADYGADTFHGFIEAGYSVPTALAKLEPYVNLGFVRTETEAYSEAGGSAALDVEEGDATTGFATLGLRAARAVSDSVTLRGGAGWRHAFGDVVPQSAQSFADGTPFVVQGAPIARNVGVVEASLEAALSDTASLGFSYDGQFGDDAYENRLLGTLNIVF